MPCQAGWAYTPGSARLHAPLHRAKRLLHLQVCNLHKALDQKVRVGPLATPQEVTYECLTLMRRPDMASLMPLLPPSFDPSARQAVLSVGGERVVEDGALAACSSFMDCAARRVLPGHLLRRCRVLSSVQLGEVCQQRVALTACTGEETVFVWRIRRTPGIDMPTVGSTPQQPAAGIGSSEASNTSSCSLPGVTSTAACSSSSHCSGLDAQAPQRDDPAPTEVPSPASYAASSQTGRVGRSSITASSSSSSSSTTAVSEPDPSEEVRQSTGQEDALLSSASASSSPSSMPPSSPWLLASDGWRLATHGSLSESDGEEGMPASSPSGPVPGMLSSIWVVEGISRDASGDDDDAALPSRLHPRVGPELVVLAQLQALRRGDVSSAAAFNLWSRSTSGGWELHLQSFRSRLREDSLHLLLTHAAVSLGPAALASPRRVLQEVTLTPARSGLRASPARTYVWQLSMGATGCWSVEAIRPAAEASM